MSHIDKDSGEIEEFVFQDDGREWIATWYLPPNPPSGKPRGSTAICVTAVGEIVLVSQDSELWELPVADLKRMRIGGPHLIEG